LVQLIDQVLDLLESQEEFIFLLDGQTVILDDYLEIRPEKADQLQRYVREGRLLIGPWYTQPDEFLISGEALVRNLLIGIRKARAFGGEMREGYAPDTFGHTAQLPQVLRGFGIESAFLTRGVGDHPQKAEFWWESLDGSRVLVHRFASSYSNASRLNDPERLRELTEQLRAQAADRVVLWMHGDDHRAPQQDLLLRLGELRARWPDIELKLGTLSDFIRRVRSRRCRLETIRGELRGSRHAFLLSGVLSSRIYLKQQNTRVQALLEQYAEPLAVWAWRLGAPYPRAFLERAWTFLLQNHAHDSICGCSIDEVHREMLSRFAQAEQIAEELIEASLQHLSAHVRLEEGEFVIVYNPTPWPREGRVEVALASVEESPLTLWDPEQGREIPCVSKGEQLRSLDVLQGVKHIPHQVVAFRAELPPLGYKVYRLMPDRKGGSSTSSLVVGERELENEFLRLTVHEDGTFDLKDKRSKELYQGLHFFEDSADVGDEYTYAPLGGALRSNQDSARLKVGVVEDHPDWATLQVKLEWALPAGLLSDRRSRSSELVPCSIESYLTLQRGADWLEIRTVVENRARDHRLRVGFPVGIRAEASWAEAAFGVVKRSVRLPKGQGWKEPPSPTHPQGRFVAVEGEGRGIALLNRGLPEYELSEDGTLYLTLLRCVGWLSRQDIRTRPGHAGPPYPTPEAQCLGTYEFAYAVVPYKGTWEEAQVWKAAVEFNLPPWGQGIRVSSGSKGLPTSGSLLRVEPTCLILSALKKAEDDDGVIVRVYNTTSRSVQGQLECPWAFKRALETNLNEEPQVELPLTSDHSLTFSVNPWQIKTLKLIF